MWSAPSQGAAARRAYVVTFYHAGGPKSGPRGHTHSRDGTGVSIMLR